MQTNTTTSTPTPTPAPVQVAVAPVASQEVSSKSYFLPIVWHRHTEAVLCSHEHRDLESATECLNSKKLAFDEMLQDPNLTKRLKRQYQNVIFSIREVIIRKTWALHSQIDHYLDGKVKPHWRNKFADLEHLPLFGFCPEDLPISELVNVVNCFHDQPKRRSKHHPKIVKVVSLSDFISYKHPAYLVALAQEANELGKAGSL